MEMSSLARSVSQSSSGGAAASKSDDDLVTASSIDKSATATSSSLAKSGVRANRSHRERELVHALGPEGAAAPPEALNQKAVAVIRRVQSKLTGRDFDNEMLDVSAQVQRLINQATSHENLCQCYIGW